MAELRHREAVHFNPDIDTDDREPALRASRLLRTVVESQFSAFGQQPWYISNTPGVMFVRRALENIPFVKEIILPNCHLVGPNHRIARMDPPEIEISDDAAYPDRELTDEEFVAAWNKAKESSSDET